MSRSALGEPPEEPGVVVRADRVARERERVEDGARFATSIDLRERGLTSESTAPLLDEAPGLHPRSTGDGLSPTTVSLRGAPASHVTLALDGVVLNDATSQGIDVSLVPPALLERADVYRGTAPVRLGVAGLGGTIELITRAPGPRPAAWVSVGYGSFHQRRASSAVSARAGSLRTLLAVSYRGTQGDFPFYDDHGTDLTTEDDGISRRVNNAGNALDVLFRGCAGPSRGTGCLLLLTGWRERGQPGPGSRQFEDGTLAQARFLARGSFRLHLDAGWLEGFASVLARRDHFREYRGVVTGAPIDALSTGVSGKAGALGALTWGPLRVEPVLEGRLERFETAGAFGGSLVAERMGVLGGADVVVRAGPVDIAPAFAFEAMQDAVPERAQPPLTRVLTSPRLGARLRLGERVELRANLAHLERAPTLPELFGVAFALAGNESLVPETSTLVDVGAVARLRTEDWNVRLEGVGFARQAHDLIVLLRSGPLALKPHNLRDADILGVEASARVSFRRLLGLTTSYAYTHAITRAPSSPADGRRVPSIPEHDLFARLETQLGPIDASADVSYVTGLFFDEANRTAAPPRVLLGASVAVTPPFARQLTLTLLGTNLLDQRAAEVTVQRGRPYSIVQPVADFAGYPLPGRSFFVALTYSTEARP